MRFHACCFIQNERGGRAVDWSLLAFAVDTWKGFGPFHPITLVQLLYFFPTVFLQLLFDGPGSLAICNDMVHGN